MVDINEMVKEKKVEGGGTERGGQRKRE